MANYILDTNILSYLIDIESQHHGKTKKFLRIILYLKVFYENKYRR